MESTSQTILQFENIPEPLSYEYSTSLHETDSKKTFTHTLISRKSNKKYIFNTQNATESNYLKLLIRVYLTATSKSNYEAQLDERQILLIHNEEGVIQKFIFVAALTERDRLNFLEQENKKLNETLENLKTANELLTNEIAGLKSTLLQILVADAELKGKVGLMEERIFGNMAEINQNTNEITIFSENLETLNSKVVGCMGSNQLVQRGLEDNTTKLNEMGVNYENLVKRIVDLEEKMKIMESEKSSYVKKGERGDVEMLTNLRIGNNYTISQVENKLILEHLDGDGNLTRKNLMTGDIFNE